MNPITPIFNFLRKIVSTIETFRKTKKEVYEVKRDKRQEKAVRYGELGFEVMNTLFQFIYENVEIPREKRKEFDQLKTEIYRLKGKFNKYD